MSSRRPWHRGALVTVAVVLSLPAMLVGASTSAGVGSPSTSPTARIGVDRTANAVAPDAVAAAPTTAPGRASFAVPASDAASTPTTTPIKHFIYLMQESHSFDNYFGTYLGADGLPSDTCVPVRVEKPDGDCVAPYRISGRPIDDLNNSVGVFRAQLHEGRNDGFIEAFADEGDRTRQAMGYYDDRDLPYYWNVADNYVLFDRFFTSAGGGSVWNHMFWVTGTPGNPAHERIPAKGLTDLPTIFDRLEEKGVSWKFYVQNYDPSITYRTYRTVDEAHKGAQVVRVPLLAYGRYLDDAELFAKIVPVEEYYEDLASDTLPSVAFMVPSGAGERPPGSIAAGSRFIRMLHMALMRSSAWDSSAFLWTYDDWGGWYDHVVPPQVDEFGYGYRAPALLVSPYAKKGYVDKTELDFTSGLKFIQENWGVEPLAKRDREANNFLTAFDFSTPPRAPVLLPNDRDKPEVFASPRGVIYLTYGVVGLVPVLLLLLAATPWRWRGDGLGRSGPTSQRWPLRSAPRSPGHPRPRHRGARSTAPSRRGR